MNSCEGRAVFVGRGTEGDRATRCLSKTKPREREAETECEEGERAPSLRREKGTRGGPEKPAARQVSGREREGGEEREENPGPGGERLRIKEPRED